MCTTKIVFLSDSSIELGLKRSLQVQALRLRLRLSESETETQ